MMNACYCFLFTVLNLKVLLNALHPVRTSWYNIGLELDIPYTELDCFKRMYSDPTDLMCEMLKYWLKTATDPCPTWEAVVAALRSPIVNAKHIAEQLETKYCAPVECIGDASNSPTKVEKSEGIHTLCECTYVWCVSTTVLT